MTLVDKALFLWTRRQLLHYNLLKCFMQQKKKKSKSDFQGMNTIAWQDAALGDRGGVFKDTWDSFQRSLIRHADTEVTVMRKKGRLTEPGKTGGRATRGSTRVGQEAEGVGEKYEQEALLSFPWER